MDVMTADRHEDRSLLRRRLVVHGHVQGVFFRDSTRRTAQAAGATGWVRNEADGSVVAEVQGPAEAVEAVERFVRQGPPRAEVRTVEVHDVEPERDETTFDVVD